MWPRRGKTGTVLYLGSVQVILYFWMKAAVLVMDNMKLHHAKAVKDLLDSSGVRYTYLPPYSPDLNPIEKLWSKVKALLRKFKARSPDALPNAIQHAFQNVSPSDCSGWFRSCGYAL